jgi:hypothetical protein
MAEKQFKTTKKVKVLGQVEYLNTATGELETMNVTSVEERDFNFTKVWLNDLLGKLGIISNAKTKFSYWFLDHINKENMVTMTYRQMEKASGLSYETVGRTMQALIGANFIVKINSGCYMVNPDVMFKGTKNTRQNLLIQYNDNVEKNKGSKETDIAKKVAEMESLKHMLKDISNRINNLDKEIKGANLVEAVEDEFSTPEEAYLDAI